MNGMNSTAKIIDGNALAEKLRSEIMRDVALFKVHHEVTPGLAVVLVGENPASQVYVGKKKQMTIEVGMNSFDYILPSTVTENDLLKLIGQLNHDPKVDGILVQLPLPAHISEKQIIDAIDPDKDVDGFSTINVGRLHTGGDGFVPCTPLGCLMMLKHFVGDLTGKHAVVIGRSNIVGKPMAALLLKESCTVTIAHSKTKNIQEITKQADILVAAIGKPKMVKADWIKKGAVVIDVGINRIQIDGKNKLVGDCDYNDLLPLASAITPVPGGVGPMTIACLLQNTLQAAKKRHNLE
jgi:methylenetetrahydrofolate dehydrogenase (NADP+)/methenyltetrahydrofolate cyclohydrolase